MASNDKKRDWKRATLRALLTVSVLGSAPALAQDAAAPAPQEMAAPSESAMVNLVRALVSQGALKADVGAALIAQAEAEAAQARGARQAVATLPPAPSGAIRVPYIPESVRTQIKEELRAEVMQEARAGSWAAPDMAAPEWTRRFTLRGDIRVRSQSDLYSKTNANDIIDFATINALSPYGIDDPRLLLPILNSRTDRWNNTRLRARLGFDMAISKGVSAGIQIATGNNSAPISTNSTLAGGFLKRDIWLDTAWVRIDPLGGEGKEVALSATFGRFVNPFRSSDLLYDRDVRFDGVAVELDSGSAFSEDFKVSLRGGAFPFDLGGLNAPTFAFDKPKTPQKYLFSGELEASGTISDVTFSASAGYHVFHNFQGDLSTPCQTETDSFCSTDYLQPIFLTKGNTLSPLRQIVTISPNAEQPQLLGYAFEYRILDLNASVSVPLDDMTNVRLTGSLVKNLGFDAGDICRNGLAGRPYNNAGTAGGTFCAATNAANFAGGDTGYRGEVMIGSFEPRKRGEWNAFGGYRYLESDAVLDALTDSNFHLGGTNSKGYFVGGNYALRDGVVIGGRWMSGNEISGSPLAIDVLQVDMLIRF